MMEDLDKIAKGLAAERRRRGRESEKAIERFLVKVVKENGGQAVKLLSEQYTGLPDRLCLLPSGKAFFVELKSKGKRPRPTQEAAHAMLRALGFRVYVVDSFGGALDAVSEQTGEGGPC